MSNSMHIRAWHPLSECSVKLIKTATMCIRWKKATFLKNWHWIFVLMRAAAITNNPLQIISHSLKIHSEFPWLASASPQNDSWIQAPILPCTIPKVTTEGKRPWRKTMEVFRAQIWKWGTPLLTMISQLEFGLRATHNCKRSWEMSSTYLLRRKRKQSAPVTWQTNLNADPEGRSGWPAKACRALLDPYPASSPFWEMGSSTSLKKWLLRHSASL